MIALAVLALSGAPIADLPFEYAPGRVRVRGRLNGKSIRVLVDMGPTSPSWTRRSGI